MQLNFLERLFILSPIRAFLQKHLETRRLLEMGGSIKMARVLEVGCGPGFGFDPLYSRFNVSSIEAFDVDPKMVFRARQRPNKKNRRPLLWVGNVRHIPVADSQYDAVFNFGAIHHVVNWRASLGEIHRVLKPGGRFYCEEILSRYITHPVIGRLMDHPQADRFDEPQFIDALETAGFHIQSSRQMAELYLWVVANKA
jgi:ubiquinone/menaquinone biosynthesis C-methylase UbiE